MNNRQIVNKIYLGRDDVDMTLTCDTRFTGFRNL